VVARKFRGNVIDIENRPTLGIVERAKPVTPQPEKLKCMYLNGWIKKNSDNGENIPM